MDVLTDILASLRLTGGVVIDAETRGDFCMLSRFNDEDCERFQVRSDELIAYHYVRTGQLYASIEGEPPILAKAGDIILLPRNDAHLLFTKPGMTPVDSHTVIETSPNGPAKVAIDNGGEQVDFYCGFLGVSAEQPSAARPSAGDAEAGCEATRLITNGSRRRCACSARCSNRLTLWRGLPSLSSRRPSAITSSACREESADGLPDCAIPPSPRRCRSSTAASPTSWISRLSRARRASLEASWVSCSPS